MWIQELIYDGQQINPQLMYGQHDLNLHDGFQNHKVIILLILVNFLHLLSQIIKLFDLQNFLLKIFLI